MKLKDRVALVTGAGSGIGRAVARLFRRQGADVWVNDVSAERARETVAELELSAERALVADVSDSAGVAAMFAAFDSLDVLVNNAGMAETPERWAELNRVAEASLHGVRDERSDVTVTMTDELWRRMLAVHLDGTFYCTREALRKMSRRGSGAIVNLSSTAALAGLADAPHYAAAKAGVLGLTRSVAREVAWRGIRINAVAPGFVETPMTAPISDEVRKRSMADAPAGRWASADEIAETILFLASDDASYITGQCLSPNGGTWM